MELGDIIVSCRGRDKGRLMFVLGKTLEGDLLLADGRLRRMENPKKKRSKHVAWAASPQGRVPEKLRAGERVSNAELRRAVSDIRSELPGVMSDMQSAKEDIHAER